MVSAEWSCLASSIDGEEERRGEDGGGEPCCVEAIEEAGEGDRLNSDGFSNEGSSAQGFVRSLKV